MLNSVPLCLASSFFLSLVAWCIAGRHDNNLFQHCSRVWLNCICNMVGSPRRLMTLGVVLFLFIVSGEVQLCTSFNFDNWQPSIGLNWPLRALSLITNSCIGLWMHLLVWTLDFKPDLPAVAMFPYPWNSRGWMNNSSNGPDQMWNSMWNPSATAPHAPQGIPRQFCGGDPQLQQQAQSQAQTQAQIKALQQQSALLNQHLANQSFSHIQHLQQLIPQPSAPPQTPHPPVSVHQEPPSPKAQPTVPPPFDSEEMMKSPKNLNHHYPAHHQPQLLHHHWHNQVSHNLLNLLNLLILLIHFIKVTSIKVPNSEQGPPTGWQTASVGTKKSSTSTGRINQLQKTSSTFISLPSRELIDSQVALSRPTLSKLWFLVGWSSHTLGYHPAPSASISTPRPWIHSLARTGHLPIMTAQAGRRPIRTLPTYLPTYLSIYLSICLSIYLSVHLSIDLSIYLPTYLSIYLSIDLSIYLSIWSIYLSIYRSIYLPTYLSTYVSIYLSIFLSIYLSIYIYIYLYLSIYIYIYLSIDLPVYLSTYIYLPIYHRSIDRSIYLTI